MKMTTQVQAIMQLSSRRKSYGGPLKRTINRRTVDLFAGVGGLSLGFQQAGFDVVGAFEYWDKAISVYRANFDHHVHQVDLSEVSNATQIVEKYKPEVVIGGPPCQDFSSAGKRNERANARLTQAFAHIATAVNPLVIVMENVPRARLSQSYSEARATLKENGYGITETVLDASYCGVPQRRKRFFCVAFRGREDGLLDDYFESEPDVSPMSVADYMGHELDTEYYYRHPRNYSRRAIYSIHEPSATVRGVNRPIPPSYNGHHLDAANRELARPLSTYERSRIQTFPPDWQWIGTKTDVEQMIGNAVPVQLARFIAESVSLVF